MAKALDFLAGSDDESLPGPSASRTRKPLKEQKNAYSDSKVKEPSQPAGGNNEDDDDDDDDADVIAEALQKHNVKAGVDVVKQASKAKGKGKLKSGDNVGGGSFQSMGECAYVCPPTLSLTDH